MKVTGIIAEYNPFHNGHKYHIEKAREITGADYCIVVMSGNFTQRGEPAVMDKSLRAQMALSCGADLVLELPVCHASASAPYFAQGATALLDRLGVVDTLVFGSECGDISALQRSASVLADNPPAFTEALKENLKSGLSYPVAQARALHDLLPGDADRQTGDLHNLPSGNTKTQTAKPDFFSSPNDILGVEYCKSLLSSGSSITPVTILRKGSGYADDTLTEASAEAPGDTSAAPPLSSALAIRTALRKKRAQYKERALHEKGALEALRPHVPDRVYPIMEREYQKSFPIFPDMLSEMLHYKLLSEAEQGFTGYLDVSRELSDRICNRLPEYRDFSSFCMLLKTKELTYTRISRSLLHIFLGLTWSDMDAYAQNGHVFYARMLGFRRDSTPLLSAIKENSSIPLLSKLADAGNYISGTALRQLKSDIHAARLYNALILHAYQTPLPDELQRQIIRL